MSPATSVTAGAVWMVMYAMANDPIDTTHPITMVRYALILPHSLTRRPLLDHLECWIRNVALAHDG